MKLSKSSIVLAALAGLLAASPSIQAQTNASTNTPPAAGPRRGGPGGGAMFVETQLTRLSEQLKLTDEQKPKVKAVLEDQGKQRQAARELPPEERRAKMVTLREEMNRKMKEILTADQFKKYEEIQAQNPRGRREGGPGGGAGGAGGQ